MGPQPRGPLDLKTRGTRLFVDAARVFALALGIAETGTAARLRLAGKHLHVEDRHVAATIEAFHFLQLLRLRQQDLPGDRGHTNRIDPGRAQRGRAADAEGGLPPGATAAAALAPFLSALSAASFEVRACVDESSGAHGRFPAGRAQGRRRGRAPAQSVAEHSERGPDATALPPALCRRRHRDHRCRSQARPAHRHRRRRGGAQSHRASRLLRNGAAAGQGERRRQHPDPPDRRADAALRRRAPRRDARVPRVSAANRRSSRFAPSSTRR